MKILQILTAVVAVALLHVTASAEDECANAVDPGNKVDITTMTANPSDPRGTCWTGDGDKSAWWKFEAPGTKARVRTDAFSDPGADSSFAVYSGTCDDLPGSLTQVGCSEDEGLGYLGDICLIGLTPGTYYVLLVPWTNAVGGSYVVDITVGDEDCGNGMLDNPCEICDGLAISPCSNGTVSVCNAECECPEPVCGNDVAEPGEPCDGDDPGECEWGCRDCTCLPPPVPMLPTWVLVGLGLVILTGGAVVFGRRRERIVSPGSERTWSTRSVGRE